VNLAYQRRQAPRRDGLPNAVRWNPGLRRACFPGLAAEWAKWRAQRPFVGTLTLELQTDADEEVASWIAAGTPPIYFGFGSIPVESPADTIAMISAASSELGERALIGAAGSDFRSVPHPDHVKVVGAVNYATVFPACRALVHHGGSSTTPIAMRAGVPQVILFWDLAHAVSGAAVNGSRWAPPGAFDGYPENAGRGLAHHPGPGVHRPGPRARHPDDRTRQKCRGRRRSPRRFRPLATCWLIGLALTKCHPAKPIAAGHGQVITVGKLRGVPIADSAHRRHTQQVWSLTCYTHVD